MVKSQLHSKLVKSQLHSKLVKSCIEYLTAIGCVVFPYRATRVVMSKDKIINTMKDGQLGTETIKGKPIFAKASGQAGISDIIFCTPSGQFGACEVKIKPDKVSGKQMEFLKRVAEKNGIALVIYDIKELEEEITKIKIHKRKNLTR